MAEIIKMPKMNLSMEDGVLANWNKKEGDTVKIEEVLCSIENEKAVEDMLAMSEGVLVKIYGEEGERYDVNTPIAIIAAPGEDWFDLEEEAEKLLNKTVETFEEQPLISVRKNEGSNVKMLPKIRKILQQKGIDTEDILKFFPGKKITETEIAEYEKQNGGCVSTGDGDIVEKISSMRRAIAKNMLTSCEKTARLTNFMEVDMTLLMEKVIGLKKGGKRLSITAFIIKACALALAEHKIINSVFNDSNEEIIYKKAINIGCAVDIEGGLVVPVIADADKKDIETISNEIVEFAAKAKANQLALAETSGGTFTVSSVGMLHIDSFTPIINYPQTAILGVGEIKILPRYCNDDFTKIVPRKIMKIGLTYDHRIIDGAPASKFLLSTRDKLENADKLLLSL